MTFTEVEHLLETGLKLEQAHVHTTACYMLGTPLTTTQVNDKSMPQNSSASLLSADAPASATGQAHRDY